MRSQSWKLALTHFSQRYISAKEIVNPSLYQLDDKKNEYASNHTIVCFDHLKMRMSDLPLLAYESKKMCEIFPSDSQ
jgi:ribonuclease BN (tRNA processing enzyme)